MRHKTKTHTQRDRQTDRKTDRQSDRQTHKETHTHNRWEKKVPTAYDEHNSVPGTTVQQQCHHSSVSAVGRIVQCGPAVVVGGVDAVHKQHIVNHPGTTH